VEFGGGESKNLRLFFDEPLRRFRPEISAFTTFGPTATTAAGPFYAFDNTTENTGAYGSGPVQVTGTDSFGAYFDVGVTSRRAGSRHHHPQPDGAGRRPERHPE
jgi:hypothetical protein